MENKIYSLQELKDNIHSLVKDLPVYSVVLFGSQARKDTHENSDWDLLIVVDGVLTKKDKKDIYCIVKRALVSLMIPTCIVKRALVSLMIPTDVLIRSELEVKDTSRLPTNITTIALKEGIPIYE